MNMVKYLLSTKNKSTIVNAIKKNLIIRLYVCFPPKRVTYNLLLDGGLYKRVPWRIWVIIDPSPHMS